MDEGRMPRQMMFSRLGGKRQSFPAKRWSEDIRADVREVGHSEDFLKAALDRKQWRVDISTS